MGQRSNTAPGLGAQGYYRPDKLKEENNWKSKAQGKLLSPFVATVNLVPHTEQAFIAVVKNW